MTAIPMKDLLAQECKNRIKPSLLREVKTEALLVFSRTTLERYFKQQNKDYIQKVAQDNSEVAYVYNTLRELLAQLQDCVVNVDYLINVVQASKRFPQAKLLAMQEEPLTAYYDVMAQSVRSFYKEKPMYLAEFMVICVLAEWILGEEKSVAMYPFLKNIDFLELIAKFEDNRNSFYYDEQCQVEVIHELSLKVIERLKNYKYKVKTRVSKSRKKKK